MTTMTETQHAVLVKLLRSREPACEAARLVLVEGRTPTAAAESCGMSRQAASNAVTRFRTAHKAILNAYAAHQKPCTKALASNG